MTTHTLHIEILPEGEPYATYRLVCSDSGGERCANAVPADDCKYLDERDFVEPDNRRCDDLWFEGHHFHHGPVGSGCAWVAWFDGDPDVSWEAAEPIDIAVPVDVSMTWHDEPLQITPVEDDEKRRMREALEKIARNEHSYSDPAGAIAKRALSPA